MFYHYISKVTLDKIIHAIANKNIRLLKGYQWNSVNQIKIIISTSPN
ncbi:MAG: hypothetical protein Ta2E_01600 [Mycoplasmoidaceae bacterium]|nr:MAG: hypothetical protein Ta2E_01600 [Mycoplasmoidaceae bacterium]